jgi:hypothetical protein
MSDADSDIVIEKHAEPAKLPSRLIRNLKYKGFNFSFSSHSENQAENWWKTNLRCKGYRLMENKKSTTVCYATIALEGNFDDDDFCITDNSEELLNEPSGCHDVDEDRERGNSRRGLVGRRRIGFDWGFSAFIRIPA